LACVFFTHIACVFFTRFACPRAKMAKKSQFLAQKNMASPMLK